MTNKKFETTIKALYAKYVSYSKDSKACRTPMQDAMLAGKQLALLVLAVELGIDL